MADDGHALGAMALARPRLVVAEGHIEASVQAVLYGPVSTHRLSRPFGIEVGREDVGAGFRVKGRAALDAAVPFVVVGVESIQNRGVLIGSG